MSPHNVTLFPCDSTHPKNMGNYRLLIFFLSVLSIECIIANTDTDHAKITQITENIALPKQLNDNKTSLATIETEVKAEIENGKSTENTAEEKTEIGEIKSSIVNLSADVEDSLPQVYETEEAEQSDLLSPGTNILGGVVLNDLQNEVMDTAEASIVFPIRLRNRNKLKRRWIRRRFLKMPNKRPVRRRNYYPKYYSFYPFYPRRSLYYYY